MLGGPFTLVSVRERQRAYGIVVSFGAQRYRDTSRTPSETVMTVMDLLFSCQGQSAEILCAHRASYPGFSMPISCVHTMIVGGPQTSDRACRMEPFFTSG